MVSFVVLYSTQKGEINNFLSSFYNTNMDLFNSLNWKKSYDNPVEITDIIAAFIDNSEKYIVDMWLCLDKNYFINVNSENANNLIKYIFERFPY